MKFCSGGVGEGEAFAVSGGGDPKTLVGPGAAGLGFVRTVISGGVVEAIDAPLEVVSDVVSISKAAAAVDLNAVGSAIKWGGKVPSP